MRFVIHVERYAAAALHRNNMALLKEIWLPLVEFQQYKNMMRANTVIANRSVHPEITHTQCHPVCFISATF